MNSIYGLKILASIAVNKAISEKEGKNISIHNYKERSLGRYTCSINFDFSHPGMALMKTRFTCSFLLSSASCNLAARAAVSPSKRASSPLSRTPPSPGSASAAMGGRLGVG